MLLVGVLQLALLHVVLRPWKRRHHLTVAIVSVPTAVIEVQVGVNHDVDFVWRDAGFCEALHQPRLILVDGLSLFVELRTYAGFDQHGPLAVAYQERVRAHGQHVARIRLDAFLPQYLRHHAEECAAIELVGPIGKNRQFIVANRQPVQSHSPFSAICGTAPKCTPDMRGQQ